MRVSAQWDRFLSVVDSLDTLASIALRHCREGGEHGSKIGALIQNSDWRAVCDYELPYDGSVSVTQLIACRQALGFFQKLEQLDIGVDKEQAAFEKFVAAELDCKATNDRFRALRGGSYQLLPRLSSILYSAQRKIAALLGPCPTLSELSCKFGPGGTAQIIKAEACPTNKMAGPLGCSDELLHSGFITAALEEVPHWSSCHAVESWLDGDDLWTRYLLEVSSSVLEFVPKNAKVYRSIAKEPTLNMFYQLGAGRYITERLLAWGIDIREQPVNQKLAREGSLLGTYATIDLSNASDTVAKLLVKFLLPSEWYYLLSGLRTGTVTYRGQDIRLEKFSTMGNGFTFPLETLIFWAITRSACPSGQVNAYGDDIICPTEYYSDVVEALECCGFTVNSAKSYACGPFRESCGCDYFYGIDIRPYYQKHLVSAETLFTLHNFYHRN
jgi:hypothetical protein